MPDRLAANTPLALMGDPLWLCERHGLKQGRGGVIACPLCVCDPRTSHALEGLYATSVFASATPHG